MSELTLFDASVSDLLANHPGASHRADPVTAHQAARAVAPRVGSQKAAVLLALVAAGDAGLTGEELWRVTPCKWPHVATTRAEDLTRLGLAEPTERTRPTESGNQAVVWCATEQGRWIAAELERATTDEERPGRSRARTS